MDFLSEVLGYDTNKHFSLKKLLHEKIPYTQKARLYKRLYASDLAITAPSKIFCPREYALGLLANVEKPEEQINTALAMTFMYGKFYENILREVLKDDIVGTWECSVCGRRRYYTKLPSKCNHCDYSKFEYKGLYIRDPVYDHRCGIDLVIDTEHHGCYVVEVKTIKDSDFRELSGPLKNHVIQVCLYLLCLKNLQLELDANSQRNKLLSKLESNYAYIIYCIKGFGVKDNQIRDYNEIEEYFTPFKEFKIQYTDANLDVMKEKMLEFSQFKKHGVIPERILCQSLTDRRAKNCLLKDICFGDKYGVA